MPSVAGSAGWVRSASLNSATVTVTCLSKLSASDRVKPFRASSTSSFTRKGVVLAMPGASLVVDERRAMYAVTRLLASFTSLSVSGAL